ncbi:MAG: hypothetical protein ABIQ12_15060, partial [Opitutaceae bacterium]
AQLLGGSGNTEQFWVTVKTNLQAGRIRMLFVADEIPEELRRVVEFLNEQMDPAEVLAVEIKQFAGRALKTLVPRIIGQTSEAGERKRVGGGRAKRKWDETSYFSEMETRHGGEAVRIARRLLVWAQGNVTRIWWGEGLKSGSFLPVVEHGNLSFPIFGVYHEGAKGVPSVEISFQYCMKKPPFNEQSHRVEWLRRINQIPGISLPESVIDRRPNFPLAALASDESMSRFVSAMDWFLDEVRKSSSATQ